MSVASNDNEAIETPERNVKSKELCVTVRCAGKSAEFFPAKLQKCGKSLSKCIKFNGKWLSPSAFENVAGMQQCKKWRQSIKCEGKLLGEWLSERGYDFSIDSSQKSTGQDHATSANVQSDKVNNHVNSPTDQSQENVVPQVPAEAEPASLNINLPVTCLPQAGTEQTVVTLDTTLTSKHGNSTLLCTDGFQQPQDNNAAQNQGQSSDNSQTSQQSFTMNLEQVFNEMEKKLTASIKQAIDTALNSIKQQFSLEIQRVIQMCEKLASRVLELEGKTRTVSVSTSADYASPSATSNTSGEEAKCYADVMSNTENIRAQVGQLQKAVEMQERERREKNVLIVGMEETEESSERMVKRLIEQKLSLDPETVQIAHVKRIGQIRAHTTHPRYVLVTFESLEDKQLVMRNRRKLAGSNIFINNDLTKNQRTLEKHLREKKKFLLNHPSYKDKKISVYKEKLWANRQLITDTDLQSLGYSQ